MRTRVEFFEFEHGEDPMSMEYHINKTLRKFGYAPLSVSMIQRDGEIIVAVVVEIDKGEDDA